MTYTPDQIARAREIARPLMREEWDEIFLGWWDHLPPVQSALAAIAATEAHVTERAAQLESASHENTAAWVIIERLERALRTADEYISRPMRYSHEDFDVRQQIASALASTEHLREPGHEQ